VGDREEGEGSSRKLVESQGGREGEGDGSFFVEKQRQKRSNLELDVDFRKSFFLHGEGLSQRGGECPVLG
jgi:hypothetical protein